MDDLTSILIGISKEMQIQFENTSKSKTSDDIAVNRENILRDFLIQYLPKAYSLGKGEVIDFKGNRSNQVDAVICTPYHPFTFTESSRGVFFCEGVACTIEIKSDLSNKRELQRGLKQIQSVKKLQRTSGRGDLIFGSIYDQERIKQVSAIIFGFEGPKLATLKKNLNDICQELKIPLKEQPDLVVLFNQGIIYNIKDEKDDLHVTKNNQRQFGFVGMEWKENTLLGLLSSFSWLFPKEYRFASILEPYLAGIGKENAVSGRIV